jgi:hypothetical protein
MWDREQEVKAGGQLQLASKKQVVWLGQVVGTGGREQQVVGWLIAGQEVGAGAGSES